MFRNVLGAQEAAVHRQSEDSITHETNPVKVIQDVQSENIAQTYPILQKKWFDERKKLRENLKSLQKHKAFPNEIRRMKSLIECLDELLEHGEMTKNCQALITGSNEHIRLLPDTYLLAKKPLGDKLIRLPRHVSKTTPDRSNSLEKIPSDIIQTQRSDEKLKYQITHCGHSIHKPVDATCDDDNETATSRISPRKTKTGIQFYVVAEPFRNQTDKRPNKKHYMASSIFE